MSVKAPNFVLATADFLELFMRNTATTVFFGMFR